MQQPYHMILIRTCTLHASYSDNDRHTNSNMDKMRICIYMSRLQYSNNEYVKGSNHSILGSERTSRDRRYVCGQPEVILKRKHISVRISCSMCRRKSSPQKPFHSWPLRGLQESNLNAETALWSLNEYTTDRIMSSPYGTDLAKNNKASRASQRLKQHVLTRSKEGYQSIKWNKQAEQSEIPWPQMKEYWTL